MRLRQKSSLRKKLISQLDLFDAAPRHGDANLQNTIVDLVEHVDQQRRLSLVVDEETKPALNISSEPCEKTGNNPPDIPPVKARHAFDIRVVAIEDMPNYPDLDHEMVRRSLETLPVDRIWFTYSAVQQCFGISRATIARRMKEGLIPGIRFCGANVLEDGSVRRFNRTQLHWLLLAVRTTRVQHTERSISRLRARAAAS